MYAANDVAEYLICSWNHHRILGPQGCVPAENMQLPAAKLIPAVSEAVEVCEERAGRLARISCLSLCKTFHLLMVCMAKIMA